MSRGDQATAPGNDYAGEPDYPSPWTTARPKEGLRDTDTVRIVCLSPDVCLTPIGSSVVPIPYQIVDYGGHDESYAETVRFTGLKAMTFASRTIHVHGDAAGTKKGIASGTNENITEPIGHAPEVRAEGHPVIRHLDRFWMNNRNTVGEAIFARDTAGYAPPDDDDPVPGSLYVSSLSDTVYGQPVQQPQSNTGTIGGTTLPGGSTTTTTTTARPTSPRVGLRRRSVFAYLLSDAVRDFQMSPAERAAEARAMQTILSPAGESVIRDQALLGGRQPTRSLSDLGKVFSPSTWRSKYGLIIDPEERIPLANDILTQATGRPVDVRTLSDEHLQAVLSEANSKEESKKSENVRVSSNRRKICFDLPPGMDRKEFQRQLDEQTDAINNMTADEMGYANWVLQRAGTTKPIRDLAAQRQARNEYRRSLQQQGLSRGRIDEIMASVNATHYLDIVAGGDPSRVGIGGAEANQEIGRQWMRDGRVRALRDEAERMRNTGQANEKMNVELTIC